MHLTSSRFWDCYRRLPADVRYRAERSFDLLKKNPRHPSLCLKKVGDLWSVRVGRSHRAIAVEDQRGFVWFWIGTHDEYERILR
jgi:hypothetical protein